MLLLFQVHFNHLFIILYANGFIDFGAGNPGGFRKHVFYRNHRFRIGLHCQVRGKCGRFNHRNTAFRGQHPNAANYIDGKGTFMTKQRTPKQQRSIQTRKRIMEAAFHLYAQKGIHGTNSKEIVEKAGVAIGSFYSYFKNKKTLLLEILEDYLDRHYLAIWKPVEDITINEMGRDDIKLLIESVLAAYGISPEFHRQTHALRYSDPDIRRVYERRNFRYFHPCGAR